jgi:chemosensory pili system protein ChpA (sensor histidine kinase/response regulator)
LNPADSEFVGLFLQEAGERLQYLREYAGILLDPYPPPDEVERLYVAAHTLKGSSAMYGFLLFSEIAAKLAHIFQYVMNLGIGQEAALPLVEFISEAVGVLESDLLAIHSGGSENSEEIGSFTQKYPFAFQPPAEPVVGEGATASPDVLAPDGLQASGEMSRERSAAAPVPGFGTTLIELPAEGNAAPEILEFFVPEAEEHLQTATECLLSLETNPNQNDIHRLFRAMHTIKGAAAQVGLQRISLVAHRAEDLIGRLREGELRPSAEIVDLCLDAVDTLKKFLYRQWSDEGEMRRAVALLLGQIARLAPPEDELAELHPLLPEASPLASLPESGFAPLTPATTNMPADAGDSSYPPAALSPETATPASGSRFFSKSSMEPVEPDTSSTAGTAQGPKPSLSESAPALTEAVGTPLATLQTDAVVNGLQRGPGEVPEGNQDLGSQVYAAGGRFATIPETAGTGKAGTPETVSASAPPTAGLEERTSGTPVIGIEGVGAKKATAVQPGKSVRIALQRLDRMMNAVGELVINRTRMLGRLAELSKLADVLNFSKARMADKIVEFQDKYEFSRLHGGTPLLPRSGERGETLAPLGAAPHAPSLFPFRSGYSSYSHSFDSSLAEFSELEMDRYDDFSILARSLTEISADITEILTQLDLFVRRVDSDIDEFTKLAHRLQDEITQARMVPIGNLYTRISRTVRDAAKAAGKQVELELAGSETELDNNIIQQIADPLLHLVRNALAHGIEREEERYGAGKPDVGKLAVRAYHRGNHIYIEVEDDGRGIDWERVRSTAVNLGLVGEEEAARLAGHDLQELLYHPGFSTAPRKSELAGRGVGLDVVRTNLKSLNGEVEIETQKGLGSRFTLKVPLTLIISQALFVRSGPYTFAFPLAFVEEIRRVRPSEIEEVGGRLLTKVREDVTQVVRLDQQLGLDPCPPANGYHVLVLVNLAGRSVGVVVEEVLRKDEIVIKNMGEYLRNAKLFPGATIAPDGRLVPLLDLNRLIQGAAIERRPLMTSANAASARIFSPGNWAESAEIAPEAFETVPEEKVVLLVDDSISVRKFVGRMLEKAGYRVKLAADGLEALETVAQTRCDLVVTDLEMPRTNGYELITHLRQNAETRDLPVMVVTSRAGAKHRDKALRQGAVAFLVKPVQEEQFIAAVAAVIGVATEERVGTMA